MKRPMASLAALGAVAALWSAVPAGAQPAPVEPRIAGVWVLAPASSPPPALTPAGQAARDANRASLAPGAVSLDPTAQCLPMGFPRNMATHFPIQIVQTPGQVTMIFQAGIRVRRIGAKMFQAEYPMRSELRKDGKTNVKLVTVKLSVTRGGLGGWRIIKQKSPKN